MQNAYRIVMPVFPGECGWWKFIRPPVGAAAAARRSSALIQINDIAGLMLQHGNTVRLCQAPKSGTISINIP
jgi:hypothetical protein